MRAFGFALCVGVVTATLAGCGGKKITVDGTVVYEKYWNKAISEIEPRAKFELDCQQLDYTLLQKRGRYPVEVGVRGCGQRAVYERPYAGSFIGDWQLGGVGRGEGAASQQPTASQ